MNFSQAFNPFRSLKSVFETMNLQPAHLWGGGVLLFFLEQGVQMSLQGYEFVGVAEQVMVFLVCVGCVLAIGLFLASIWLAAGLFLNFRSVAQTGEVSSGGIFDHQGKFLPLFLTRLLVGLASILAVLPLGILIGLAIFIGVSAEAMNGGAMGAPSGLFVAIAFLVALVGIFVSIYVGMGLVLSEAALLYEDREPVDAVKRSWEMAKGNRLRLFAFVLVVFLFTLAGLFFCCVGVIATGTIARFSILEAFLQLSETQGEEPEALLKA